MCKPISMLSFRLSQAEQNAKFCFLGGKVHACPEMAEKFVCGGVGPCDYDV